MTDSGRDAGTADGGELFAHFVADLFEAAGAMRQYGERLAGTAGQTQARWQLMSVVSSGEWTVPMAAERLGNSRQAVQRIANELVADGLAELVPNPRHQRSPFLRLTATGRRTLATITRHARRQEAALVGELDGVDLAAVRRDLQRVTERVRARDR